MITSFFKSMNRNSRILNSFKQAFNRNYFKKSYINFYHGKTIRPMTQNEYSDITRKFNTYYKNNSMSDMVDKMGVNVYDFSTERRKFLNLKQSRIKSKSRNLSRLNTKIEKFPVRSTAFLSALALPIGALVGASQSLSSNKYNILTETGNDLWINKRDIHMHGNSLGTNGLSLALSNNRHRSIF